MRGCAVVVWFGFFILSFLRQGLTINPGWPETQYVDQADLDPLPLLCSAGIKDVCRYCKAAVLDSLYPPWVMSSS